MNEKIFIELLEKNLRSYPKLKDMSDTIGIYEMFGINDDVILKKLAFNCKEDDDSPLETHCNIKNLVDFLIKKILKDENDYCKLVDKVEILIKHIGKLNEEAIDF